jgi:dTDP-4-dehydrorhamnose reductase
MDDSAILITGGNGQLGIALRELYPGAWTTDTAELDITDWNAVKNYSWDGIKNLLNAAAYTNVDGAESPEGRIAAWKVNAAGVANLVRIAYEKQLTLVHISTEYIFDGTQKEHKEDEPLSPLGVYAQSKAAGEIAATLAPKSYVLRTSWVIGEGKNFVRTMLGLGQKGINPTVVGDQIGRPTFATELARGIDHLLKSNPVYGIYNISNGGEPVSWADFTRTIFHEAGFDLQVTDTTTEEYFKDRPEAAPRPLNSTFDLSKIRATGFEPRDWHENLSEYIKKEMDKQ